MSTAQAAPSLLQQSILDTFAAAFPQLLSADSPSRDLAPLLQQVKHHLYERDFAAAFGHQRHLDAYAVRWSASRALAYLGIFAQALRHLDVTHDAQVELAVICIGGGAGAEYAALAALPALYEATQPGACRGNVVPIFVDMADWSHVLAALHDSAKRDIPHFFPQGVNFVQHDVLSTDDTISLLPALRSGRACLVTLMFTLNELYATSRAHTHALLLVISVAVSRGTLLLVVDSPGSYSTVKLGPAQTDRQYPMRWLLDHALMTAAPAAMAANDHVGTQSSTPRRGARAEAIIEPLPVWEKLAEEDSTWFRLPQGLRYPIELENMRYQMHLYRKR